MFDVIFMYNGEPNAAKNYRNLRKQIPWCKRVQNASTIKQAHLQAAETASTDWFFTVDADNWILDFDIFFEPQKAWKLNWHAQAVTVYRACNPTNALIYGWGAIKLWPKSLLKSHALTENYQDFTTQFPTNICNTVASCHEFNTSPWDTWRSVYRETSKLLRSTNPQSKLRLNYWKQPNKQFAYKQEYLRALNQAVEDFEQNIELQLNNWQWLKLRFEKI